MLMAEAAVASSWFEELLRLPLPNAKGAFSAALGNPCVQHGWPQQKLLFSSQLGLPPCLSATSTERQKEGGRGAADGETSNDLEATPAVCPTLSMRLFIPLSDKYESELRVKGSNSEKVVGSGGGRRLKTCVGRKHMRTLTELRTAEDASRSLRTSHPLQPMCSCSCSSNPATVTKSYLSASGKCGRAGRALLLKNALPEISSSSRRSEESKLDAGERAEPGSGGLTRPVEQPSVLTGTTDLGINHFRGSGPKPFGHWSSECSASEFDSLPFAILHVFLMPSNSLPSTNSSRTPTHILPKSPSTTNTSKALEMVAPANTLSHWAFGQPGLTAGQPRNSPLADLRFIPETEEASSLFSMSLWNGSRCGNSTATWNSTGEVHTCNQRLPCARPCDFRGRPRGSRGVRPHSRHSRGALAFRGLQRRSLSRGSDSSAPNYRSDGERGTATRDSCESNHGK
ncbi:hypothetical protein BDK51DRAFT_46279 [Blyttiomyces helicus]|uniref:Uncharacterized protein n=1 Tax=Blyttiomyces helicus TaxID=388810 RepID=A0A4P9VZ18_9FUNG|nr:hypothetical protein BDK51DRAFT_46279 [Blyttiomyces helicus]|eukprot:RKO84225.1 hypothetical protein BDK51DRAFT_46279 [Blyttiomyces helicus]